MKCSVENINKLSQTLLSQMEDENGRGEFDGESDLLTACETVIDWFEEVEKEAGKK